MEMNRSYKPSYSYEVFLHGDNSLKSLRLTCCIYLNYREEVHLVGDDAQNTLNAINMIDALQLNEGLKQIMVTWQEILD